MTVRINFKFLPKPAFANDGNVIGHGGSAVSHFLQENMHRIFESVDTRAVPHVVDVIKGYGGYFRRFRGGALEPWAQTGWDLDEHTEMNLTLEAYATLAFLQVNNYLLQICLCLITPHLGRYRSWAAARVQRLWGDLICRNYSLA
jgi:hypothetical protein